MMPSTCLALRPPTMAPVTAGWRSVQAIARVVLLLGVVTRLTLGCGSPEQSW